MLPLTLLTPVYNRATFMTQLYDTMKQQTNQNFQWLVVDDGSTDNIKAAMEAIINQNDSDIKITFVQKPNGGKHSALNYAHGYIEGQYVLVVDSDDFLYSNSVEKILTVLCDYKEDKSIGWIAFLRGTENGDYLDNPYPETFKETTYVDYLDMGRVGECCDVYQTEVFKKYPYPEIPNEHFVSESYLNIRAALYGHYKMLMVNEVVQIGNYQDEGLTSQGRSLQLKNPLGNAELWRPVVLKSFSLKMRLKGNLLYAVYSLFGERTLGEIIKSSLNKPLTILSVPPIYMVYLFWKIQYREL
ncbi:glycosyltransferase family 2 protein [Aerococcus urinaeequi]|uniref:glycosyltransferase family 2 protein n=1 Tax=Aerococcus urinaeequi TaxID=51665 RepID=UPI003AAA60C8